MIIAADLELRAGARTLVEPVSFRIQPGDRIGLVGRNGAGKTTLLKTLARETLPFAGKIDVRGDVGYLPQDPRSGDLTDTARDRVLSARGLDEILRELDKLQVEMAELADDTARDKAIRRYGRLEERFGVLGGYAAEAEAARICSSLGLPDRVLAQQIGTLSGGQRRRVELARILFAGAGNADATLLLDEPTNHLDADSIGWLRDFLRAHTGGLIVISHDVDLLEKSVNKVFHLDANRAALDVYNVGWKTYLTQRDQDEKRRKRERANAEKKIDALKTQADKMRAKATKARAAHQMDRRADRLAAGLAATRVADKVAKLRFPTPAPCGRTPLTADGLSKSYGSLEIFTDVDLAIDRGARVVILGLNGAGKTTLLRLLAGELKPHGGTVVVSGGLGVMQQFVGSVRDERTVRDLLVSVAEPRVREVAGQVDAAELAMMERDDEAAQLQYAQALSDWAEVGGYDAETVWDTCTMAALGTPYERAQWREVRTLSGGEQKRLVLEALLRGPDGVLLLDEPDNYLDVPGKRWLEEQLKATRKTVLFVSHDRELLSRAAEKIVSVEPSPAGSDVWVHGGSFETYHEARQQRFERFEELGRRWDEKHAQLKRLVADLQQYAARSPDMASRYQAAKTRLRKFEEIGPPPEPPRRQDIRMRLRGGRTGVRALTCAGLELTGLMRPFDLEVFYGERVAVLGSNGSGKSHLLRLLAGQPVAHTGQWKLGARVVPGHFAQTHAHPELAGHSLVDILWKDHAKNRGGAMSMLRRYELEPQGDLPFEKLSGGQQARFQILLLELAGSTALLLDEPTDNLDLESAEALQTALESFEGTVLAVTHDRWFARTFDRFLAFGMDGQVRETAEPVWDEGRVERSR